MTTQDSFTAVAGASLFVESVLPADDGSLSHTPRSSMVKTGQDGSFDLRVPPAPRYRARGYDYTSRTNLFQDEWAETAGAQEIARDFVVR